jgi:type II secretory pathway predicted ATPase ExeA
MIMIANLQAHWGFTRMPFGRDIPADNLFRANAHNEAVARLRYLISARGLGVLTGEVGAGKTVAVRSATHGLDTSRHTVIYLPNPSIGTRGLHGAIATALGQAPRFHHATLIPQVEAALHNEFAEKGRHIILIIDEAHLLDCSQLEAVRMLTNSEMDSFSPLSIILVGQPALRRRLKVGDMAALDQRVQLRYHIPTPTMDSIETKRYVEFHLSLAGRTDTLFSDDAITQIHNHARGVPRAINNLSVAALLAGYATKRSIIDESSARTAITEATATD